ncbi:hypothetical protein HGP13_33665 [Mesorhizobium sp. NZP2077]|uniref:hypothetical protein n=1 Tax=Mesorhizobium sp. NZP2077 TaxID=2483404 RepID=UPI001556C8BE|nr:hypothetical protein [Mesorhizobium sp. NZP2077]QKD19519.1 hypothetical protein HGP13_33665 [Mesorhizobium sp. NZP2077]
MDLNTSVRLSAEEQTQLTEIFGADPLANALANLGKAALREYVEMLLGQSTLRSPDAREQRLLLLILEANDGAVPGEAKVAQMFNLTRTGARSLIRSVLSRYRLRLAAPIRKAAIQVLQDCGPENDGFRRVSVGNPVVVEYLNSLLAELNGELKRIAAEARTGTFFRVPEDSYLALNEELNP